MDYFDDTFKSSQKIREILGVPVIGEIARIDSINKVENFNSLDQTDSSVLNAFGILRINVNRLIQKKSLRTILVTGPALGEGKTTIAANLAMAFARAGRKVVLLDTDMYHPTIHSRFGLDNKRGLTNILTGDLDWQDVALDFDGITVITSGVRSVSSTALLESQGMDHLLEKLQKEADIVIIDGPPMFIADSQVLALKVDGILLVVRQGGTITAVARAMLDQLKIMDVHVIGVVLNCIPRTDSYYFDGYYRIVHKDKNKDMQKEIEVDKS
jgi:capsular exopolysaccharide synthesis family protein